MTDNKFTRTEMLLGTDNMDKLKNSHVAVFGVGGVGSYAVESLARSGVGHLTLIDADVVSASNINRQLIASTKTVGMLKVDVAKARIAEINPNAHVCTFPMFFDENSADKIDFSKFDYIVDAIDSVKSKITLIMLAKEKNIRIISCMGAGNKLDPTMFEVSDISKTSVCPLARVMRRELGLRGINHLKVVYSKELAITPTSNGEQLPEGKRTIPGSVAFVPGVAGMIIAGEVIKDICNIIN